MLWICLRCTTAYSVGAEGCPHCGSTEYADDGTEEAKMAKISRHGGATTVGEVGPPPTSATPSVVEVVLELPDGQVDVTEYVEPEGADDAPDGPYGVMLRADLQALCAGRGLATSGNKPELIARLAAADEAGREEQDSDPD